MLQILLLWEEICMREGEMVVCLLLQHQISVVTVTIDDRVVTLAW